MLKSVFSITIVANGTVCPDFSTTCPVTVTPLFCWENDKNEKKKNKIKNKIFGVDISLIRLIINNFGAKVLSTALKKLGKNGLLFCKNGLYFEDQIEAISP